MPKITKRHIDSLRPNQGDQKDLFAWDSELRGFGVRMKPSGSASYIVQYRTAQGRTRRYAFAKVGTFAPDQALTKARQLLAEVEAGADPSTQRHEERQALTVAELCGLYLEAARAGLVMTRFRRPKRPSTIKNDESRVSRHIVPLIGNLVARDLSRAAVQRMVDAIATGKTAKTVKTRLRGIAVGEGGAIAAARVSELLGGIWTWAERRAFVNGTSPTRGVETRKAEAKDRILSPEELTSLGATLCDQETLHPEAVAAIRLLALTGLRREEACGLRWREIDWSSDCLRLDGTKTGKSTRPIGRAAFQLLSTLPHGESEWVFPDRAGTGRADLKKRIAILFDAAGLRDARSHDLRRTFASVAADEDYSDATVAELLGHARRGVTARHYIRRPDAALVAAADRVATRIVAALDGQQDAKVFDLQEAV